MRRTLTALLLAGGWLLADPAPGRAQVIFGPVGHTGWGFRSGFHFAGPGYNFGWSWGSRYAIPVWGPVAVGPWGAFGGVGVTTGFWGYNPWVLGAWGYHPSWGWGGPAYFPPPVAVVPQPPLVFGGANNPWANGGVGFAARQPAPAPVPAPDRQALARVDAAVKRGDLLVVRPNGGGVQPAAGMAPPQRAAAVVEPAKAAVVPAEPKARAVFEVTRAKETFAAGQYGRAAERLADAITATPDDPLPYFLLAQARTARGEYPEAVAAIRDGMRRSPDWPAAKFRLKEVYGPNAAAFAEHLDDLKRAAAAAPDDPTLGFLLGYHLWFLGETADAVRLFKRATKQVRDNGIIERFLLEAEGRKT